MTREWRKLFPGAGFSDLREQIFANPQTGSPENVIIDRVLSVGSIAKLPPAERDRVIARVRKVIANAPELAGKPEITFPNTTCAYSCRKLA